MFAHGLDPIPTNFADPENIAHACGRRFCSGGSPREALGFPRKAGPWDTAMPAWEKFLKEEEMWEAILFLYDFTGQKPRAREEHAK